MYMPSKLPQSASFFFNFAVFLCFETLAVRGQQGDGCGQTVLSSHSGTLASKDYPGTYPNHTSCEWTVRVAQGSSLILVFGDFDIEYSKGCSAGSLRVIPPSQVNTYSPFCGNLNLVPKRLEINASEVKVKFRSASHRSGRGFLLSYFASEHADLISCLVKGIHYSEEKISAYCPAGCKGIHGDIWGKVTDGYRDTSVLCKAAIHAGVISDDLGGQISVSREKGITLYEPALANGIQSKTGSLSEKKLKFQKDCDNPLAAAQLNASSSWHEVNSLGEPVTWSAETAQFGNEGPPWAWAPEHSTEEEWLEIDLSVKKNITGIITKGTGKGQYNFYVKSYRIEFSKDGKSWRDYKTRSSGARKIFDGNTDNYQQVRNNFIPPIVGRYVRLVPLSWNRRIAMKVELLGCQASLIMSLRPRVHNYPGNSPVSTSAPTELTTITGPVIITKQQNTAPGLLPILVAVGVVLLVSGAVLLTCLCIRKRKTKAEVNCAFGKGCHQSMKGQACCRVHMRPSDSELISYPVEEEFSRTHLPEYAEPDVPAGQKAPSTFRPAPEDGYTVPLIVTVNHYDIPGKYHEYAEPLPPEPEYATPFMEQALDPSVKKNHCVVKVVPPSFGKGLPGSLVPQGSGPQYDSPPQRVGACGDKANGTGGFPAPQGPPQDPTKPGSVYAEPQYEGTPNFGSSSHKEQGDGQQYRGENYSQPRDSVAHVYHEVL
ncbi:discoidin, CUB and LCCL domain-containing protein 1 isoform X2 [Latimeria chalumnae]|uniref:discoidin, CUB and LCCL domain-containing protein 1 isoform X2 n=1 Tax=Latimeria chalumnae TaxID=7897 RepID=UPI00313B1F1C